MFHQILVQIVITVLDIEVEKLVFGKNQGAVMTLSVVKDISEGYRVQSDEVDVMLAAFERLKDKISPHYLNHYDNALRHMLIMKKQIEKELAGEVNDAVISGKW